MILTAGIAAKQVSPIVCVCVCFFLLAAHHSTPVILLWHYVDSHYRYRQVYLFKFRTIASSIGDYLASYPGPSRGGGERRAWYTLRAHAPGPPEKSGVIGYYRVFAVYHP